jgi:hypothetical protein
MKGGKEGRKRKSSGNAIPRQGGGRGKPKKGAKTSAGAAPKKGSRKKSYGAVPRQDDD